MLKICKKCGKSTQHYANGLCESCYNKLRYKNRKDVREYHKRKSMEWRVLHPERWKEINKKAVNKFYHKNK